MLLFLKMFDWLQLVSIVAAVPFFSTVTIAKVLHCCSTVGDYKHYLVGMCHCGPCDAFVLELHYFGEP